MNRQVTELKPAYVRFRDICQYFEQSKEEFFALKLEDLPVYEVFGLTHISDGIVKVLYLNDHIDNEDCEGICIPINDIVEVQWLKEDESLAKVVSLPIPDSN